MTNISNTLPYFVPLVMDPSILRVLYKHHQSLKAMNERQREKIKKSLIYASKTLLGGIICWYGLRALGVVNPVWSVITVIIVSDPVLTTTMALAKTRAINTVVGCLFGLSSLLIFGYMPAISLLTAALTVLVVNYIERYPSNWRLAPATVIIMTDAAREVASHEKEIEYALVRMCEIGVGCVVALALAGLYTRLSSKKIMTL